MHLGIISAHSCSQFMEYLMQSQKLNHTFLADSLVKMVIAWYIIPQSCVRAPYAWLFQYGNCVNIRDIVSKATVFSVYASSSQNNNLIRCLAKTQWWLNVCIINPFHTSACSTFYLPVSGMIDIWYDLLRK